MDIWLFTNSHLCQFIEIVHKIINWYMKKWGTPPPPPASYASVIKKERKKIIYLIRQDNTIHWHRKRGVGMSPPPTFFIWGGGGQWYVYAPPPLLTPQFYFPLELYVYITLTNNYLAFFIYQLIILWTISIN